MWPHSADLRRALSRSHEMVVQVDVFNADGPRASNVKFSAGTVQASMMSDVSRTGSLTVSRRLTDQGLFDPRQDRVRISTGVRGFPLVPLFTGRVQDVTDDGYGSVQVQVDDFGRDLVQADFEQPWRGSSSRRVAAEMRAIIQDANPEFGLEARTGLDGPIPIGMAWEQNRTEALDELAMAINCVWQSDRTGSFVLYPNPYNLIELPPLALVLSDGVAGTLTSLVASTTRSEVCNSVTVLVERPNNTTPARITVRDTDPGSPFRWGGQFGKVNRVLRLQTPGSTADASVLAHRVLNQSLALSRSWRLTTPHFPLLDPGDVIGVTYRGQTTMQVVESITYPLAAINGTSIATRELRQQMEVKG